MRVTVEVTGDEVAALHLRDVGWRATNLDRAFQAVSDDLMADERTRFATNGYGRWPALSPLTIKQKGHARPLVESGRLMRALTVRGAAGQRLDIDGDTLIFGLQPNGAAYYGRFHKHGRGVPKRPLLTMHQARRVRITNRVRSFIVTGRT